LCRSGSIEPIRFVALTEQQLAVVTNDWFHSCPFCLVVRCSSYHVSPRS
jgi:hypothetical protein